MFSPQLSIVGISYQSLKLVILFVSPKLKPLFKTAKGLYSRGVQMRQQSEIADARNMTDAAACGGEMGTLGC